MPRLSIQLQPHLSRLRWRDAERWRQNVQLVRADIRATAADTPLAVKIRLAGRGHKVCVANIERGRVGGDVKIRHGFTQETRVSEKRVRVIVRAAFPRTKRRIGRAFPVPFRVVRTARYEV